MSRSGRCLTTGKVTWPEAAAQARRLASEAAGEGPSAPWPGRQQGLQRPHEPSSRSVSPLQPGRDAGRAISGKQLGFLLSP